MIAPLASPTSTARRRVLIVDDERVLRDVLRRYLDQQGWLVTEADSAEQGLAMIEACAGRLDAVLVDQNLPGLSGSDFCHRLTIERPGLSARVLLASGDAQSASDALGRHDLHCQVLAKPFELPDLDRALALLAAPARLHESAW